MAYNFAEGPYKSYIELFVKYKKGKGEKCVSALISSCATIARALSCETSASGLEEEKVREILEHRDAESDHVREYRVSTMRQLCSFLNTLGIPCWQVPPRYFTAPRSDFRPYILSDADIKALLSAADALSVSSRTSELVGICPVLVRLLLSSGLRISEALALSANDFNANTATIYVVNSKNGVSRVIPLTLSMSKRLHDYLCSLGREAGPIFKSPYSAKSYSYETIRRMFKKLYEKANIKDGRGNYPRIHDLRHTFCTKSLDHMIALGMDVYEAVPILAAYVGHVNWTGTERYIHLSQFGHEKFVASEVALSSLIPKVVG